MIIHRDSRNFYKNLKRTALSMALGMCFAGGVQAQSTSGAIFGKAQAGQAVTITNVDSGASRTVTADANGNYRAVSVLPGNYKVSVGSDSRNVLVHVATGSEVDFTTAAATTLDTVTVTGSTGPTVDVSQTDTRTVFTAKELAQYAVGQNLNDVSLLAPGVISSTSYDMSSAPGMAMAGRPVVSRSGIGSFGGAAASENAYYINGYPVTNPLASIGFTALGFDSIDQQQVLLGGYGAEYGRSTGGVVSVITKRGTNQWKGGVYAVWTPKSLKGNAEDIYYPDTGHWSADSHYTDTAAAQNPLNWTDGTLYMHRKQNTAESLKYGVWAGGPVIEDRLFVYANAEREKTDGTAVRFARLANVAAQGWNDFTYTYPRWTAKVDWNITDKQILELTGVQDNTQYDFAYSGFDYDTLQHDDIVAVSGTTEDNARLYVGKYTGYWTDNLTISALYGQQKIDHLPAGVPGYDPSKTFININSANVPAAYSSITSPQPYLSVGVPTFDKTKGYRFDAIYALGNHELRAGVDHFEAESFRFASFSGPGYRWTYAFGSPSAAIDASHGVGSPASGGGLGTQGYYVTKDYNTTGGKVRTVQHAWYLEDRWQVTDNFLLSLGLRNDGFDNYNGDDKIYVSQKDNWAPRIGFSWDVKGDSSLKVYGNAGRYHLAMPNNVAIRAANGSLIASQFYTYTSINADGTPNGLTPIPLTTQEFVCGNGAVSTNKECGVAPDPRTVSAEGLKAHYQDEYILGMEQVLDATLSWGAKLTYRDLKSAIDDNCSPVLGGACFILNPGEANTFWIQQEDGSFEKVTYSAGELALPKLKRRYAALDLFAEYNDGMLRGKLEYTLAHNWGNAEGQLNSSTDTGGGGQSDVSVSQDWDLPELMAGAGGPLPNNRTHQVKAFGSIKLSHQWRVGGSMIVQSGRPRSCTSFWPYAKSGIYNSASYYYCGVPGAQTAVNDPDAVPNADYHFSPRGAAGETPWTATFNLNVTYTPSWLAGLSVGMDVLNLFDTQTPTAFFDRSAANRTQVSQRYGQVLYYTDPRSVRLTVRYDF